MENQFDNNGLRKLVNAPSGLVVFLVVSFNKIPLFSEDLITFIIFFISLFVSVFPNPYVSDSGIVFYRQY